jgi:hypothetical protein
VSLRSLIMRNAIFNGMHLSQGFAVKK